jgi:LPS-assembly protein
LHNRLCALLTASLILLPIGSASGASDAPLTLQLDTRLRGSAAAGDNGPIFISADRIESDQPDIIEAYGDVEARQSGRNFFSDYLRYNTQLKEIAAKGNVRFEESGGVLRGKSLTLKLDTYTGNMIQPEFTLSPGPGRGNANRADFKDQSHFTLDQALFTTCPVDDEDWKLTIDQLDIDQEKNIGTAHNALLTFKHVPLLYSPWMNFPLDNRRKSGMLAPTLGTTSKSGFEITLPYYFNLAPNYDATLSPRYMSRRGLQLGGEARYLMDNYKGSAEAEYLNDQISGNNRWAFRLQHQQALNADWIGKIDFQRVSDNNYFRDLSTLVSQTSQSLLPEQGSMDFDNGVWHGQVLVQQFQLLQDPNSPLVKPYSRLPEISLGTTRSIGWFETRLDTRADYFSDPIRTSGARLIAYPQVLLPWSNSYASATAKFGVNATYYALDSSAPERRISRVLPISSLDARLAMDRDFSFAGTQYQQTLEPRAYYVYIPYRDQSQIPVFDTARLDLNLDSLFRENQYIGGDRINDANQFTIAVTSRFIDAASGTERLNVTLGQRYYLDTQRVTLPGETPRGTLSTDFLAGFGGQINAQTRLDGNWEYDTGNGNTYSSNLNITYRPKPTSLLNVGYRYVRGSVEQIDLSSEWPLGGRVHGLVRVNYSLSANSLVEGLAGFEYNGGCWALRSVIQRLATAQNSTNNAFFIQLELNGLGQLGSNPIDVLKQSIPGYANSTNYSILH